MKTAAATAAPRMKTAAVAPPAGKSQKTAAASLSIDPEAIQQGIYWTFQNTGGVSEAEAIACEVPVGPQETPHECISIFACKSPRALLRAMRRFCDTKPADFNHSSKKIARVEIIPDGFIFTTFNTFKEACEAHARDHA